MDPEFRDIIDKVPPFVRGVRQEPVAQVLYKKPTTCIHLGKVVERSIGQCAQKCRYQCEAGRGLVRPAFECKDCRAEPGSPYEADSPHAPIEEAVSLDHGGIGDVFCAIAAAKGIGPHVQFVCPAHLRPWANLFATVADPVVPIRKEHKLQLDRYGKTNRSLTPRWEWFAQQCNTTPKLPALRSSVGSSVIAYAGRIVISPFSAHANRTWPLERWVEVNLLLIAKGFSTLILDDGSPERTNAFLTGHESDWWCWRLLKETPQRVAAAMSMAAGFCGNDSGMAHLAGMLGIQGVAVCSRISDARIFGLYPTIEELGGRHIGFDRVAPVQVAETIMNRIASALGDFPNDEFGRILTEADRWRLSAWLPVYAALWRTVRELQPRTIVEIGCRAGYSSWTFLRAIPDVTIQAFDANLDEHGGYIGASHHASTYLPSDRWKLTVADSHSLDVLPECDMVYIDGDHSRPGCYQDLRLSLSAKPKWILVDDPTNCREVKEACDRFIAEFGFKCRYVPSATGLYVITVHGD